MVRRAPLTAPLAAFATLAAALAQNPLDDPTADPFNLLEGIDDNGRILRPELPPDLTHPQRWRYTPPGRIAPGGMFDRFLVSTFFAPVVFRDEDVGTGGGVSVTDIDFRNQDYQEFANFLFTYTTEGQQAYFLDWRRWPRHRKLENGGIIREERTSIFGTLGYTRTLTRRYFGMGSRTSEGDESSYLEGLTLLHLGGRVSLPEAGSDWLLTGAARFEHHELGTGRVEDVPSTSDAFAPETLDGDGVSQGWVHAGIAYDTRDSLHQPYRGWRTGIRTRTAALQTGGEFGGIVDWDGQVVLPVPALFHAGGDLGEENPPTDVVALHATLADSYGDLPYYSLPSLGGGNTLRGYIRNRFTDRALAYGSFEYRMGLVARGVTITEGVRIERIGLGFFYDFGTVAPSLGDLSDGRYLDSYGVGLRLSFAREASFRLDFGVSEESTNFTIRYGHAF